MNSRYYNAEWNRFINADGITGKTGELLSHNMYMYCMNNPINMCDDSGYMPKWLENTLNIIGGVATMAAGAALAPECPILAALMLAHGFNQLATTIGGDSLNFEKKAMGNQVYNVYDLSMNVIGLCYGVRDIHSAISTGAYVETKVIQAKRPAGLSRKYWAKHRANYTYTEITVYMGKASKDIGENVLSASSLPSQVNNITRNSSSTTSRCRGCGSGSRCLVMMN